MSAAIIPGAEPFFFPGGEISCLLAHGFTGAPKETHRFENGGHVITRNVAKA